MDYVSLYKKVRRLLTWQTILIILFLILKLFNFYIMHIGTNFLNGKGKDAGLAGIPVAMAIMMSFAPLLICGFFVLMHGLYSLIRFSFLSKQKSISTGDLGIYKKLNTRLMLCLVLAFIEIALTLQLLLVFLM